MRAVQASRHYVPQFPQEFNPRLFGGLLFWYDASLGISLNVGNVSAWADQSGNGYSQLQATGAKQPPWSATADRGARPGVSFTGTQGLQTGINVNYGGTNKITVFLVGFGTFSGVGEIIESSASAGTVPGSWNIVSNANSASDIQFTSNATGSSVGTPFFVPSGFGSPNQVNCVFDMSTAGVQATARYNGAAVTLTAGGAPATGGFSNQQLNVGARSSGGQLFWNGTLCAVIGYGRGLTLNEIVRLEKYLGATWGVPH